MEACTYVVPATGKACGKTHPPDWLHEGQCRKVGCLGRARRYKGHFEMWCQKHWRELEYLGGAFLPDPDVWRTDDGRWHAHSRSRPGHVHDLTIALDGEPICRCEGYSKWRHCWHTTRVKEEIAKMTQENPGTALVPIVVRPPVAQLPSVREIRIMERVAHIAISFAGTKALPKEIDTEDKALAVILYGHEIGLKPMTALSQIYFIEGRPQPSAPVMAGIVNEAEKDARLTVVKLTEDECTMRFERPSRDIDETYTVTTNDSDVARLIKRDAGGQYGPGGWILYRRDRLRWHCTKRILRIYAPDLILGLIGREEDQIPDDDLADDEDDIPAAELFNEGDPQGPAEPGQSVDTNTGELKPTAPPQQRTRRAPRRRTTMPAQDMPPRRTTAPPPPPTAAQMDEAEWKDLASNEPNTNLEELPFEQPKAEPAPEAEKPARTPEQLEYAAKLNHARVKTIVDRDFYARAAAEFARRFANRREDYGAHLEYWLDVERLSAIPPENAFKVDRTEAVPA